VCWIVRSTLDRYESVPAIKRRMTMAAKQQGKRIMWKRRRNEGLPFDVRTGEQPTTQATSTPRRDGKQAPAKQMGKRVRSG
jgi:hypothetical protein